MAMHTTVHLTPSDVIAIITALRLYREQIQRSDDDGKEQDTLHVDNLITKLQR